MRLIRGNTKNQVQSTSLVQLSNQLEKKETLGNGTAMPSIGAALQLHADFWYYLRAHTHDVNML